MRTYANREQILRLAWKLFESQVQDAKGYLEPKEYKINGINYEYRRVQASLDTLYAVENAVKAGMLKATKKNGLQRTKRTNNTK